MIIWKILFIIQETLFKMKITLLTNNMKKPTKPNCKSFIKKKQQKNKRGDVI